MIGSISASAIFTPPPSLAGGQSSSALKSSQELSPEEEKEVQELKKTDAEVRAHEQAHKTVGGPYASPPQFETVTGPDGREYAVAGEVKIDASPIDGNPEATIRKMEIVARAALAPAEPSPQDIQVARAAQSAKLQAQKELAQQDKNGENGGENSNAAAPDGILAAIQKNLDEYTKIDEQQQNGLLLSIEG